MSDKEIKPVLISRYSSRRLYNTEASEYVTLDEVAELIRNGREVVVVDKKSGEDITRQILLQIITEHEARGENVLPRNILNDIIRSYSEQTQSFVPEFLSQSFDAFKMQQEELLGTLQNQFGAAFPNFDPMENLQNFRKTQEDMLTAMMTPWTGTSRQPSEPVKPDPSPNADPAPGTERDETIAQMKEQIEQMQKMLKDL